MTLEQKENFWIAGIWAVALVGMAMVLVVGLGLNRIARSLDQSNEAFISLTSTSSKAVK